MSKFVYEDKKEISIVSSQCELCYNEQGSEKCPKDKQMDLVKMNEIWCPNMSDDSLLK